MIILMLLGTVIFSLTALFIYKKTKKDFKDNKKLLTILLSFIIFALGLEVTIFNVNFYNTRNNEDRGRDKRGPSLVDLILRGRNAELFAVLQGNAGKVSISVFVAIAV